MSEFLFKNFEPVSAKSWKQKIQVDLKGADYNDTLLWHTNEGITVKPFYHSDDIENPISSIPTPEHWLITQLIVVKDELSANEEAKHATKNGAESIFFEIDSTVNLDTLFHGLDKSVEYQFKLKQLSKSLINSIIDLKLNSVKFNIDIIGQLAKTGNWFSNLEDDFKFIEHYTSKYPELFMLAVDLSIYQNSGANITQQIAYALAHTNEYLNFFNNKSISIPHINFISSTSSNYFFEIAKLKALRQCFYLLSQEYKQKIKLSISAFPSLRNKTLYDYNVNMLRTTTECMSAILGGADSVCNLPYDFIFHNSNEFGERISRNQLLVLKEESSFDLVSNPADGSYYIEKLTEQLSEKALEVFKSIEHSGGFLKQLKSGTIQRKIKESADFEQEQFDSESLILLGTNKYPNDKDLMKNNIEKDVFPKKVSRKTLIEPILSKRLATASDLKRINSESE